MLSNPNRAASRVPQMLALAALGAVLIVPMVALAATSGAPAYSLVVSRSSGRGSAAALSGATLSGAAYIYVAPPGDVKTVDYWLDSPAMTGSPTHVEHYAPFDFAGTDSAGAARPWNTAAVADGSHSISVQVITRSSGTFEWITTFDVVNGTPEPTPAPTSTPGPTATAKPTPTSGPTAGPTAAPTPTANPTPMPPIGGAFVGRSGTQLTLNGQPWLFTGFNIYQANSRSNCSYTMGSGGALDKALTTIGPGAEVFRTWFFQREATTNGQRDWSALDHTLAIARAHHVRVIVTLGNQWGSCESQASQYKWASWYQGGYKTQVLPGATVPYRQWVQEVVARYRNDATVAMWQLMNEAEIKLDNTSTCGNTADLYNFAADVSGLVKSIDANHLVSLGTMGAGQCGSKGGDYQRLHSIPTIDVCEYHDYGHETTALPANLRADLAACNALGKPLFVGESGIRASSVGGTLAGRAAAFDAKATAMFGAGVRGFLVWSWNNAAPTVSNWPVGPGDPTIQVITRF